MIPFQEYKKLEIRDKLKFWMDLPQGATLPDDWPNVGEWHFHIRDVCKEAFEEITFLRSVAGAVSQGRNFEELRKASRR